MFVYKFGLLQWPKSKQPSKVQNYISDFLTLNECPNSVLPNFWNSKCHLCRKSNFWNCLNMILFKREECLYLGHCTYLIFQRPQQQQAPKTKEIATLVKYTRIAVGAKLLIKSSTILCDKMQKNDWKTNFLESKQQKGEQILDESNRDRSSLCYFFSQNSSTAFSKSLKSQFWLN